MRCVNLVVVAFTFYSIQCAVATGANRRVEWQDGMNYLTQFGYVQPASDFGHQDVATVMAEALKSFQWMARINQTGELDSKTEEMMLRPRCGVRDENASRRVQRYAHSATKWNINVKKVLTWTVSRYTRQLRQSEIEGELQRAFETWAAVTPLKFERRSSGPVDIDIAFASSGHGDPYPFDGRGGTLAHAYYPPSDSEQGPSINGDTHFDESEQWTINSRTGSNLFYVAVHELGHALGLQHSNVQGSIMWPWAGAYDPNIEIALAYDDVLGIQTLYGGRSRPVPTPLSSTTTLPPIRSTQRALTTSKASPTTITTTKSPTRPPTFASTAVQRTVHATILRTTTGARPLTSTLGRVVTRATVQAAAVTSSKTDADDGRMCARTIDEIVLAVDKHAYGFVGGSAYRFGTNSGVEPGFPKSIDAIFPNAPRNGIDAAVTFQGPFPQPKTYLFKGSMYYRYSLGNSSTGIQPMVLDSGFPKTILQGWGLAEKDFDAVFLFNDSKSLYFVKGTRYWRHGGTTRGPFPGYPRQTSSHPVFRSLPGITAAFRYTNDRNYFFYGTEYYRYHEADNGGRLVGPRPTGLWWFGCIAERLRISELNSSERGEFIE